jgi:threonine dehydrogenase-like Zn-dependent dehydrogenase
MACYQPIGGHEGTGTVILAGHLVTDIKVGDHVAIKVYVTDPYS